MPKIGPGVTLDRKGDAFILRRRQRRGRPKQITLSANDVLQLAPNASNLRQTAMTILNPRTGALFVTPIARVVANPDALSENLLVGMADRSGGSTIYELVLSLASDLVEKSARVSRNCKPLNHTSNSDKRCHARRPPRGGRRRKSHQPLRWTTNGTHFTPRSVTPRHNGKASRNAFEKIHNLETFYLRWLVG